MRILETERTFIDSISLADAPFFVELLNSPGWLRFIGDRNVRNIDDAKQFLQNGLIRSFEENGFGYYLIRLKQGDAIGTCGFMKKPYLENNDFGFALLPQYHGQGFGFEAGQAILNDGVEQFDLKVVDAVTDPQNIRSIVLLEKLGFDFCGSIENDELDKALSLYRLNAKAS